MTINYHTVVKFPQISGIPKDAAQNTFSWIMPGSLLLTDMTEIHSAIQEFYNTAVGAGNPLASYISDSISRASNAVTMTTYAIPALGGHLGAPVDIATFTLATSVGTSQLPSELAVCLSFHGDYTGLVEFAGGTRPRARTRGRIYLGPLSTAILTETRDATTHREAVNAQLRTDLAGAAARLRDRTASQWAVWSRTTIGACFPVVGGWVDDAFDVQRRRGEAAIARTTF